MKSSYSKEPIAQQLVRGISTACFSFFILGVIIFTVIAVMYHPPDPWLHPGKAITKVLSSVTNATFQADDSVLPTGEDFALSPAESAAVADVEGPAITSTTVSVEETTRMEELASVACNPQEKVINCSDPGVLAAIVAYNLMHFTDLNFYAYQTPVRGNEENECDVAWRFRARKEKSWRMYRDFRRFSLTVDETCKYTVMDASGWHSGKNAKRIKARKDGPFAGKNHGKHKHSSVETLHTEPNVTRMEEVEVIEDSVPTVTALEVNKFTDRRYLMYARGGDHCKKMNHYLWSFLCALGEAQYLNRTLVMDLNMCLSSANNPGHADEEGKDFRFYFDFAHLKDSGAVIEQKQFFEEWELWRKYHPKNQLTPEDITDYKITPMALQGLESTIVIRTFQQAEPDNYWYRVCEGETEKVIQRPWHLLWKSKRIMDIVNAICGQMEWDFDAVHIVRGEKAQNKELWPNLDADTTAEALVEKLRGEINSSRYVYIATNEVSAGYFDVLKEAYRHAYTLDDFSVLWAKDSLWYNQTLELTGGEPVDFDGYMRVEVDTEVTLRAKKTIETFGFLTKDCKDGVNTC